MDDLKAAIAEKGPTVIWGMLSEEEQTAAATTFWADAEAQAKATLVDELAKQMKFRTKVVRKLPAAKLARRLVRMAPTLPAVVLFQFLFFFHISERRELMAEFLDVLELPHSDGLLETEEDAEPPAADAVEKAGDALIEAHGDSARIYLSTLRLADEEFWGALDPVLERQSAPEA